MKLEVRCCCTPLKLLGWLEWPDDGRRSMRFLLLRTMAEFEWDNDQVKIDAIELEVSSYYSVYGRAAPTSYKAVKDEGLPIEVLRRVPGFTENKHSQPHGVA
jgi:hypothetical protein